MKRAILIIVVLSLVAGAFAAQSSKPASDPWSRVDFLAGEWTGQGSGAPGEAEGGAVFSYELNKSILVRKSWAGYAPRAGEKTGARHEDLLIIYRGAPGEPALRAIYFDMEGHVIPYDLLPPSKPDTAVFESDASRNGPRYRLSYELGADGELLNIFSIAMPGQDFKEYVKGRLKKK